MVQRNNGNAGQSEKLGSLKATMSRDDLEVFVD